MGGAYGGVTVENIVLIIALCASFLFAAAAGYLRFRYERKKTE